MRCHASTVCCSTDFTLTKRTHVGFAHGAQDRLRIVAVVFGAAALAKRCDEVRGHQTRGVAELAQPAAPVMSRAAGFHPEGTGRQVRRPLRKAMEAELAEVHRAARGVARTHDDDFFCEVHTDGSNLIHEFPSLI